jgi:hypothetical protein
MGVESPLKNAHPRRAGNGIFIRPFAVENDFVSHDFVNETVKK